MKKPIPQEILLKAIVYLKNPSYFLEHNGSTYFNRTRNIDRPITPTSVVAYVEAVHGDDITWRQESRPSNWFARVVDKITSVSPQSRPPPIRSFEAAQNIICCLHEVRFSKELLANRGIFEANSGGGGGAKSKASPREARDTTPCVGVEKVVDTTRCGGKADVVSDEDVPLMTEYDFVCSCLTFLQNAYICSHVAVMYHLHSVLNVHDLSKTMATRKRGRPTKSRRNWSCMEKEDFPGVAGELKSCGEGGGGGTTVNPDDNPQSFVKVPIFVKGYGVGIVLRHFPHSEKQWLVFFLSLNQATEQVQIMRCVSCPLLATPCQVGKSLHLYFTTHELILGLSGYKDYVDLMCAV